jgi:hypothetical protein
MANAVVNRHCHKLADGRIVWHAHPFKKNKDGSVPFHTHTDTELIVLDALSNPVFPAAIALVFLFVLKFFLRKASFASFVGFVSFYYALLFFRRGPPSFSLN